MNLGVFSVNAFRYCFSILIVFCCFNSLYAQPANELCVNAEEIIIIGGTGTGSGSVVRHTGDQLDAPPACGGSNVSGNQGFWYTFTGTGMTLYEITTCNEFSVFDTKISVYTGSCGSFTCVTGNDDSEVECTLGYGGPLSTVNVSPTTNTLYYVYVVADGGGEGLFNVDINDLGPFDECTFDTEPPVFQNCPEDFTYTDNTGSCVVANLWTFPTLLDNCPDALISGPLPAGTFVVGESRTITLKGTDAAGNQAEDCIFTVTVNAGPPPNDLCVDAEEIIIINNTGTGTGTTTGTTTGFLRASTSTGAPPNCGAGVNNAQAGVWYTFTGTGMTLYEITTCNSPSAFDTEISVFTGSCGSFTCVAGNDNSSSCGTGSTLSALTVTPTNNTTYYVYVTGEGPECGKFNLEINDLGEFDECTFDTEPPVFENCPEDIVVTDNSGACGRTVGWQAPNFEDNCPGGLIRVSRHPRDNYFLVGVTETISYTGTDAAGNAAEDCVFTITVNGEAPANDLCADAEEIVLIGGTGTRSGYVGTATSTGAPPSCGMGVNNSAGKGLWYTFSGIGMTLYEITTCNSPSDFDSEISVFTGSCGSFTCVGGSDNSSSCGTGSTLSTVRVNPSTNTTYYIYVKGGDDECEEFKLEINDLGPLDPCANDTEAPAFSNCPNDINLSNDDGECGAIATWTPPILEDNCSGATSSASHDSGDFFPVGTTTVTYSGSDAAGNIAQDCSFTVTINDTEDPVYSNCPNDINLFNDEGDCGAIATWTPPVLEDNCSGATSSASHDSGDFFPVGTTIVTYSGTDAAANNAEDCTFKVSVTDAEKPMIACPGNISKGTDPGVCGAQVNFTPPFANDNCELDEVKARYRLVDANGGALGGWTSRVTDPSGYFPIGRYQVQWRAEDIYGNKQSCSHYLEVYDDEDPIAECKDLSIEFNGEQDISLSASQVWDEAASSDNCGYVEFVSADLTIGCEELGNTVAILVTIRDGAGNEDDCTAYVDVLGLPCGWSEGPNDGSLNCDGQTTSDYDIDDESFKLTSDGCWHDCLEADKATYVYHPLCGDGTLTAKLASINTRGYAGLMARESLDPWARRAGVLKNYSTRRVRREWRASYGGVVSQAQSNRSRVKWLRIVRVGNQIKSYTSTNGSYWRLLYKVTYSNLNECIYVGMTTYSTNGSSEVQAVFEDVTLSGSGTLAGDLPDNGINITPEDLEAWGTVGNVGNGTIEIFPNPASDQAQLILEDFQDKPAQLFVRDAFGKVVRQIDLDSAIGVVMPLEVQDLTPGLYILSLVQDGQLMSSKKLIVQP